METILKTVLVAGAVLGGMSIITFILLLKKYSSNHNQNKMRARVKYSIR